MMEGRASKTVRACQRCRRQKLKCDVQRPCTLCTRAGTTCVAVEFDRWRAAHQPRKQDRRARGNARTSASARRRAPSAGCNDGAAFNEDVHNSVIGATDNANPPESTQPSGTWHTSSTIGLIEEAFRSHDSSSTQNVCTTALSAGQSKPAARRQSSSLMTRRRALKPPQDPKSTIAELAAVFPAEEPARMLLNTYFDRIHWFMLLFHQDEFRASFAELISALDDDSSDIALGPLVTALAVCAISLHYLGPYRRDMLIQYNIDAQVLKDRILDALGRALLEILALGSMHTVQTCVLMGTYYLYHGQPDVAWPLCGCALRAAQAIGLHRKVELSADLSAELLESSRRSNEARKRCWWAIYEIETFCSMLYGLPSSISDSDCDVEELKPSIQDAAMTNSGSLTPTDASLLFYKPAMSQLATIVKTTLSELYGKRLESAATNSEATSNISRMSNTTQTVNKLDGRLRKWYAELPIQLREAFGEKDHGTAYLDDELERVIGASGPKFELTILELQSISLKLAFENARILVHRPLLSYKMVAPGPSSQLSVRTPCESSIKICREASLATSRLGSVPIFDHACSTYAAAFIGMHLLTAGITLCILTGLEPLSNEAHESKLAVQRLMHMQSRIQPQTILADQGLKVLKKLMTLTVERELGALLASSRPGSERSGLTSAGDPSVVEPASTVRQNISFPPVVNSPLEANRSREGVDQNHAEYHLYEDENLMQAILNFDQAVLLTQHSQDFENSFMDQEQGWIWSHDFTNG